LTSGSSGNFEVSIRSGNIRPSIQKTFEIFECSLDDLPAISNLTTSLDIYEATAGWTDGALDYLGVVLKVEDWKIIDKLVIRDLSLDIRARSISSGSKQLSLYSVGLVKICDVDLNVAFEVTHDDASTVTFDIATEEHELRLGPILKFFSEDKEVLPSSLADVLNQTTIDAIMIQAVREDDHWALSLFALAMSIQTKLDITGW